MNHIITTKNGQGKALKCLHCNRFSRLKLKKGLMNYAKELADFERVHQYCQPQADGRGLRYAKPTPTNDDKPHCLICGKEFKQGEGKVPLYRNDQLSPAYAHEYLPDTPITHNFVQANCAMTALSGQLGWVGYQVGHHNLVVQSKGEWLYFWQGQCGSARNKAEASRALDQLCNTMITNGFIKANEAICN